MTATSQTALRLRFVGANPAAIASGQDVLPGTATYLSGSDPASWHTGIPTYGRVAYRGVYPGIDLIYDGTPQGLEYTWQVAPGADPGAITLTVDGVQGQSLDGSGNLVLQTGAGPVIQYAPHAYQDIAGQRQDVSVRYVLTSSGTIGLALGAYDTSQPLVIDPTLSYATYLGGSGFGVAVDGAGATYIVGCTALPTYPTGMGTQPAGSSYHVMVSKLSPDGHTLLYSTTFGGSGDDCGYRVAIDAAGNAYVTGSTTSPDFPTVSAYQATAPTGQGPHAFVAKLNADGTALLYSTLLAGSGSDVGFGISVDTLGDAYVAGATSSSDFPTTTNAITTTYGGQIDAFVAELDPTGSSLLYGTYLGGSSLDAATDIAVDQNGTAYVTGVTASRAFPTANPRQGSLAGYANAFVAALDPTNGTLLYGTYLGGNGRDAGTALTVDAQDDVYVTGVTTSSTFPTTPGAYQRVNHSGGKGTAFAAKLAPATGGSGSLLYSTLLGGSGGDAGFGIAVDSTGAAYVTGATASRDFPVVNAVQGRLAGGYDAFVAQLGATGGAVAYATYLGGSANDAGFGIALDPAGSAVVSGSTQSTDFPVTSGAMQGIGGGSDNAFVARLATSPNGYSAGDVGAPVTPGSQTLNGGTLTVTGAGSGLGGTSDQLHSAWQEVGGDSAYSVRVISQTATGAGAQAGLLYRASTDPDAAFYGAVISPNGGNPLLQVLERDTQGMTVTVAATQAVTLPLYLRVGRQDTTYTTYTSTDGVTWTAVVSSAVEMDLPGTVLLGVAVASGSPTATNTAAFDTLHTEACPDGWTCGDVGSPASPGSQTPGADPTTFGVLGTGADVGGTADEARYVWQSATGDSSISGRVAPGSGADPCAKIGLMYRNSADADAAMYSVALTPGCDGTPHEIVVQARAAQGATATTLAAVPGPATASYLRVTRSGDTFTAETSPDGVTWTALPGASATVVLSPTALLGVVATAHGGSVPNSATVDHLSLTGMADLGALDTDTAHYTQTVGQTGTYTTDVQLSAGPAGAPDASGWRPRDPTLGLSTSGAITAANLPFDLQIAPTSAGLAPGGTGTGMQAQARTQTMHTALRGSAQKGSAATASQVAAPADLVPATAGTSAPLATLTNEDGITLGIGLPATPGASVTGVISGNSVTYPGILSTAPDWAGQPITTVAGAGDGSQGYSGDGGPATQAKLMTPADVTTDAAGNLYIVDSGNNVIREVVAATGIITTVVGGGSGCAGQVDALGDGCPAGQASLNLAAYAGGSVAMDRAGDLYIADTQNNVVREVLATNGQIGATSVITRVAGDPSLPYGGSGHNFSGDGGPATQAGLAHPFAIALDDSGNIYIDDTDDNVVREVIAATGVITTIAGSGTADGGFGGDGGPATAALLGQPRGIAVDHQGNVYIGDQDNDRVREIIATGGHINASSVITTVAGTGSVGYSGDGGPATEAQIGIPFGGGMRVDAAGNLFVTDTDNGAVREVIAATGVITTVAGGGSGCPQQVDVLGDGCPADQGDFYYPAGVGLGPSGTLYVADTYDNAVRAVTPSGGGSADLELRATGQGLDARIVLPNAQAAAMPLTLALTPDERTQIGQDPATGAITLTQPLTDYDGSGNVLDVVTQTEYIASSPLATDSNPDPASVVDTGPATATLGTALSGQPVVMLRVDPAWLSAPGRQFPVAIDLPIATASAAQDSGRFGTLNSCQPLNPAPATEMVVGIDNGCTYRGYAYIDAGALDAGTPILSATLNVFVKGSPAPASPPQVLAYPNDPASSLDPTTQVPSWATAPMTVAGSVGIAPQVVSGGGSDGYWLRWDVSSLIEQWAQNPEANEGVTLSWTEAPLTFASAQGVGLDSPARAAYLDVTYSKPVPSPSRPPLYNDKVSSIYGNAGTYIADGPEGSRYACGGTSIACNTPDTGGPIKVSAVHDRRGGVGSFIRYGIALACPDTVADVRHPGAFWWNSSPQSPIGGDSASPFNVGSLGDLLSAGDYYRLVPIIDLLPNGHCRTALTPDIWYYQAKDLASFVSSIEASDQATFRHRAPLIYLEVGNEPTNPQYMPSYLLNGQYNYAAYFASAAQGWASGPLAPGSYRILTAGAYVPTAAVQGCSNTQPIIDAARAIDQAQHAILPYSTKRVSPTQLGVAVHPYGYVTADDGFYWRNYFRNPANINAASGRTPGPGGICHDLAIMIRVWRGQTSLKSLGVPPLPQGLPLVFTEMNWSSDVQASLGNERLTRGKGICGDQASCQGTYMIDLFTYLYDHQCLKFGSVCPGGIDPRTNPLRIAYFRGVDEGDAGSSPDAIGLYDVNLNVKQLDTPPAFIGTREGVVQPCTDIRSRAHILGLQTFPDLYYWLRNGRCY